MGFLDVVFGGRKRLKEASGDKVFALSTAAITLDVDHGLKPAGFGAVCFKPLSAGEFAQVKRDLDELVDAAARDSSSEIERTTDTYGYEWIVVRDRDLEDVVGTVHLVGTELKARGFGPQLLAAVFRFEGYKHPVYFVYGYKRGVFWPYVPSGKDQERDNAYELDLKAKLERELPIEQDLSMWFALAPPTKA